MLILRDRKWNEKERFILQYVFENNFISYTILKEIFPPETPQNDIIQVIRRLNERLFVYGIKLKCKKRQGYDLYIC